MNWRLVDWIWQIRGTVALPQGQSSDEAFDRLAPLFRQTGTSHDRASDTLTFHKKDAAAQDKMATFESGVLRIDRDASGPVMRYRLVSRTLLFCFLAPLLFLAFAQLTVAVGTFESATNEAKDKSKKDDKKDIELPQSPIDKALGAPAPEKPKKDGAEGSGEDDKKPSPTAAYVFAGLFAALYVVGRALEDRLVKRLFQKTLLGS